MALKSDVNIQDQTRSRLRRIAMVFERAVAYRVRLCLCGPRWESKTLSELLTAKEDGNFNALESSRWRPLLAVKSSWKLLLTLRGTVPRCSSLSTSSPSSSSFFHVLHLHVFDRTRCRYCWCFPVSIYLDLKGVPSC